MSNRLADVHRHAVRLDPLLVWLRERGVIPDVRRERDGSPPEEDLIRAIAAANAAALATSHGGKRSAWVAMLINLGPAEFGFGIGFEPQSR